MDKFSITFIVRWADLDANGHVRNSAILDYSVEVRMHYFGQVGFSMHEFGEAKIGPVVFLEELIYKREIRATNMVRVDLQVAGISDDGARWILVTNIYADETLAAVVTAEGGWLDLEKRKLRLPPKALHQALKGMPRSDDFQKLKNLNRE